VLYCAESGDPFVTAARDESGRIRRVEVCSACGGYLKDRGIHELCAVPAALDLGHRTTDLTSRRWNTLLETRLKDFGPTSRLIANG